WGRRRARSARGASSENTRSSRRSVGGPGRQETKRDPKIHFFRRWSRTAAPCSREADNVSSLSTHRREVGMRGSLHRSLHRCWALALSFVVCLGCGSGSTSSSTGGSSGSSTGGASAGGASAGGTIGNSTGGGGGHSSGGSGGTASSGAGGGAGHASGGATGTGGGTTGTGGSGGHATGGSTGSGGTTTSDSGTIGQAGNPNGSCKAGVPASGQPADVSNSTVVGSGTPASCTFTAINAAVAKAGAITFNCGGGAVTIPITATMNLSISKDTIIDGGDKVTLDGGHAVQIFNYHSANFQALETRVTLQHLKLVNGKTTPTDMIPPAPAGETACSQGYDDGEGGALYMRD